MKTIKIIAGNYGHNQDGKVVLKTAKHKPFDVPDQEADRLVNLKVAEFVDITDNDHRKPSLEDNTDTNTKIDAMNLKALKKLAKEYNIELESDKVDDVRNQIKKVFEVLGIDPTVEE